MVPGKHRSVVIVCDGPVPHLRMNHRGDALARHLASMGRNQVDVVCPNPEVKPELTGAFPNVRFHFLPPHRTVGSIGDALRRLRDTWTASRIVRRILRNHQVDCIRSVSTFPTVAALLARGAKDIPVVANLSDFYSDLYTGSRLPLVGVATQLIELAERAAARADVVVVDTPEQRERWIARGLRRQRCIALPHGLPRTVLPSIELSATQKLAIRERFAIPSRAAIAMYVGDIGEMDGVDILLEAAASATQRGSLYALVLIGNGSPAYLSELQSIAGRLSVMVHRLPSVPNETLPHFFSQATVCVAPFRTTDTTSTALPNKVLEYLTSDRPIIATAGTALQRSFGNALQYAPPGDPEVLANLLVALRGGELSLETRVARQRLRESLAWRPILERESALIDMAIAGTLGGIRELEMVLRGEPIGSSGEGINVAL